MYIPCRSPSNGWLPYLKFFGKAKSLCRMSSLVVGQSPSHDRFARVYNDNVWTRPSVVDADLYEGCAQICPDDETVSAGWTGSESTAATLRIISQPLAALGRRDDVELRFVARASSNRRVFRMLERLVADPELRERVGRNAELVLSRYTLHAKAERIVAAFRSMTTGRRHP